MCMCVCVYERRIWGVELVEGFGFGFESCDGELAGAVLFKANFKFSHVLNGGYPAVCDALCFWSQLQYY